MSVRSSGALYARGIPDAVLAGAGGIGWQRLDGKSRYRGPLPSISSCHRVRGLRFPYSAEVVGHLFAVVPNKCPLARRLPELAPYRVPIEPRSASWDPRPIRCRLRPRPTCLLPRRHRSRGAEGQDYPAGLADAAAIDQRFATLHRLQCKALLLVTSVGREVNDGLQTLGSKSEPRFEGTDLIT